MLCLNVVLISINMIQKTDYLILAILSETTEKAIVQTNIICAWAINVIL